MGVVVAFGIACLCCLPKMQGSQVDLRRRRDGIPITMSLLDR
jgi:hypothetical protein